MLLIKKFLGFASFLALFVFTSAAQAAEIAPPQILDCKAVTKIGQFARKNHLNRDEHQVISDGLASRIVETYTNHLIHSYSWLFTRAEVAELQSELANARMSEVASGLASGDCSYFESQSRALEKAFWRFKNGWFKRFDDLVAEVLAAKPPTAQELASRAPYAETVAEARARKIGELAFQLSVDQNVVTGQHPRKQAAKHLLYQFWNRLKGIRAELWGYAYDKGLKSYMHALDPHSVYLNSREQRQILDDFTAYVVGIGVTIELTPYGAIVREIVPGGPAAVDGRLKVGDTIFAVNGYSTSGVTAETISRRIKGGEKSPVKLWVGTIERGVAKRSKEIVISRGRVPKSSSMVSVSRRDVDGKSVVAIRLEEFYKDSGIDLLDALSKELGRAPVDAVVLDLRDNPGGIVFEAIVITSLFVGGGPVMAARDANGEINVLNAIKAEAFYKGPLVVAVNGGSASASEIVSGTLKDYQRAIVVGSERTYGKGSMQGVRVGANSVEMPIGGLILTEGQFYTAGGASTQLDGVESDIVVPGPGLDPARGERGYAHALPADSYAPFFGWSERRKNRDAKLVHVLPALESGSAARVSADPRFAASPSAEAQLDEIMKIAAEYSIAAGSRCVVGACVAKKAGN